MVEQLVIPAPFFNGINSSRNSGSIFLVLDSRSPIVVEGKFHGNDRKSEPIEVSFQRAKMLHRN